MSEKTKSTPSQAQRWWRAGAKAALERANLNQSEAARLMGDASESYLSRALSPKRADCGVGLEYLFSFCKAVGTTPIHLLTWGRDRVRLEEELAAEEKRRHLREELTAEGIEEAVLDAVRSIRNPELRRRLVERLSAEVEAQETGT